MDLENSIIPKVEREIPSTLDISEKDLPCIRDWEVGKRYLVQLSVESVGKNQGSLYDPNDESQLRAQFRVTGAQSLEPEEQGMKEPPKKESKSAFIRLLLKMMKED